MIGLSRAGACGSARGVARAEDRGGETLVGGTWEEMRVVVLGGVHDWFRHRGAAALARRPGVHGDEGAIWEVRMKFTDGDRLLVFVEPCVHWMC